MQVVATNVCGSTTTSRTVYVSSCGGAFVLYPNPTNGEVLISASNKSSIDKSVLRMGDDDESKSDSFENKIFAVKIIDKIGVVRKYVFDLKGKNEYKLALYGIPSGLYIIQVFNGYSWESSKLIVK